jgi:hypothetical protein
MHGADGTNRRASWVLTVHAQATHEFVVLGENDREFMLRLHRFGGHFVAVGQLVLLGAAAFTLFATNAQRRVIQQGLTHGNCSSLFLAAIDSALGFGWRSASALQELPCGECGFSR